MFGFNVRDFGAPGVATRDSHAGVQGAIDAATRAGGGTVLFPPGDYRVSRSLEVRAHGIRLVGESRTGCALRPFGGAGGFPLVRFGGSYGGVEHLQLDGSGLRGMTALRVAPVDEGNLTARTDTNYNHFAHLWLLGCEEGIVMRAGPDVGGADSGCWYNTFLGIHVLGCVRGIYLRQGPNSRASGVNRNQFYSVRVGQPPTNVGVHIEAGDTNTFVGCSFEGITSTGGPHEVPTAIVVEQSAYGGDNNTNRFIGASFEACTRDLDNRNRYTELHASNVGLGKFAGVPPRYNVGGEPSQMALILPGLVYSEGSLPGPAQGEWEVSRPVRVTGRVMASRGFTQR